jgi:hypothetical protein
VNVSLSIVISILVLVVCCFGFYVSYRLWAMLGKKGITSWFMLAFLWAIGLRTLSLLGDLGYHGGFMDWTRPLSAPMYGMLVLGLFGLYRQVRKAFKVIPLAHPLAVDSIKIVVAEVEVVTPTTAVKVPGTIITLPGTNGGK